MRNFNFKEKDTERVKNIDIEKIISSKRTLSNKKKLKSLKINSNNINNFTNIITEDFHPKINITNNNNYICSFSPDKNNILPPEIVNPPGQNGMTFKKKGKCLPKININKKRSFPLKTESNVLMNNGGGFNLLNNLNINLLNPNFAPSSNNSINTNNTNGIDNSNNSTINFNSNKKLKFNNLNFNDLISNNTNNNNDICSNNHININNNNIGFVSDFNKFKLSSECQKKKMKSLNETKKNGESDADFPGFSEINEQLDDILNNIDNDGVEEVNQKIKELNQSCTNFNFSSTIHEESKTNNSSKQTNGNEKLEKFDKIGNQTQRSFNPNLLSYSTTDIIKERNNNNNNFKDFNKMCLSTMTKRRKYEEEENIGEDFYLGDNEINKKFFANYTNYGGGFFNKERIANKNFSFNLNNNN